MRLSVNTHIHSPYSFSAFGSIDEAVTQALAEQVAVLGLSDFNTVEGFGEFGTACTRAGVYPLYNIEFIALSQHDRDEGVRWNDPRNPGIIYFCGKGLSHPVRFGPSSRSTLENLWRGSQEHMRAMIDRINQVSASAGVAVSLEYGAILERYARTTVRERHLARALCDSLTARYPAPSQLRAALAALSGDDGWEGDGSDSVRLQDEVRSRLLKSGRPAFVPEPASAFLPLETVRELVLDGGGIPCYPILADDSGPLNERERDPHCLAETLRELALHAVEFIPARNSLELLERYSAVLQEAGMCITFGTEHNTPAPQTLVPAARGPVPLSPFLEQVAWEGACLIAAHQHLTARGETGYVDCSGSVAVDEKGRRELIALGERSIAETSRYLTGGGVHE